jgi:hypothetical protein
MSDDAVSLADRIQRVVDLDLEPIVYKLMHPEPGVTGMALADADRLVELYRRWLILILRHPNAHIVPTRNIDTVWHTHILDTAKYAADCQHVFGFPLHHFPYLGLRGAEDEARLRDYFTTTRELFEHEFGVPLDDKVFSCDPGKHAGFPGGCVEGMECEHFAGDQLSRVRPRPVRVGVGGNG